MSQAIRKELAALERMTVGELHERYAEVFGEAARSRHREYLIRRIGWRIQADAEGGLSERALRRAAELADVADVRVTAPKGVRRVAAVGAGVSGAANTGAAASIDPRLPAPGSVITRKYKGRTLAVTVLADGFEYAGERYPSLTAVAEAITGSHVNGFRFFKLGGRV